MRIFDAPIETSVIDYFNDIKNTSFDQINLAVKSVCGIHLFFSNQSEVDQLYSEISDLNTNMCKSKRAEYGDFQTNIDLSNNVCKALLEEKSPYEVIVEPTCGKGNFILSALKTFDSIRYIYGVEIFKPYIWETKFSILAYFIDNCFCKSFIPEIHIFHCNVFDFNFSKIRSKHIDQNLLIIGNPPWVTNAKLSTLSSNNLPVKSNFKKHSGISAMTGKGNFDIGEYISINLLSIFSMHNGKFAFLIKNSVIKNLLSEQKKAMYQISDIKQFTIDAKKEFQVSVNASLFACTLGVKADFTIKQYDFYNKDLIKEYGWVKDKFVSNTTLYKETVSIDATSPFIWRQGVKHDAASVMELEKTSNTYKNKNGDIVDIEQDLVFCLLKSSDLKGITIDTSRKHTIITQKKIGQDTQYIRELFPKTYKYLLDQIYYFNKRKSIIYKGKPPFSIFGIGDYSFKPYKVAISGMYKTTLFSLVKPNNNKPIMLDDTCYFIGFDKLIEAEITRYLLNKTITQNFIRSIAFKDAKRMITKDLLMRIDLNEIANLTNLSELQENIETVTEQDWISFKKVLKKMSPQKMSQLCFSQ